MSRRQHEALDHEHALRRALLIQQHAEASRRLREAVALHRPGTVWSFDAWTPCRECKKPYPCPTARAAGLDEEAP